MAKVNVQPKRATAMLYPGMSTFVTCRNGDRDNIITITWQSSFCPDPPILGISVTPKRFSYDIIKNSGEYIINIPNKELLWELHYCGFMSGRDVDKFEQTGLTRGKANVLTNIPTIEECIGHIECKICNIYPIAEGAYSLFVAEAVSVTVDDKYFNEAGWITGKKGMETLHYLGGTRYAMLGETVDFKEAVKPQHAK